MSTYEFRHSKSTTGWSEAVPGKAIREVLDTHDWMRETQVEVVFTFWDGEMLCWRKVPGPRYQIEEVPGKLDVVVIDTTKSGPGRAVAECYYPGEGDPRIVAQAVADKLNEEST